MKRYFLGSMFLAVITLQLLSVSPVFAASANQDFSFDNFAGTYYLEKDSKGVSRLTTQEDMNVVFSTSSHLYGIRRELPTTYQGHNVDLNVIGITDSAGNPVVYQISTNKDGNKVITTGDKDITLGGIQTYKIKYQTTGVAAFYKDSDEFLINVNGRGWSETFDSVKAFIHLAPSFSKQLIDKPICYIGYKKLYSLDCTLNTQKTSDGGLQVNAATKYKLGANQSLIVKMNFKKATFKQKTTVSHKKVAIEITAAALTLLVGLAFIFAILDKKKSPK